MQQIELQMLLVAYMNAATDLAESIRADLHKGDTYSNETVLKLSQFKQMAEKVQGFVDMLEQTNLKYN